METARGTEEITEICPIVRQEARDREETARQEVTEARDAASIITETADRAARKETGVTSAAEARDRALTGEIPVGMK